jgi:two-component system cell cycle sensor histidine kinase/response regulator CckA
MLQRQGYRVLVAPAGPEAIDLFADHHDEISLLVTDLVMPKMSGQELAARLRDERPELAVLYMSGYSEDVVVVGEPGHGAFLEKPFSVVALARSVRAALDAERP